MSEEPDVKSMLGKVTTGDADAGLVYVTDVTSAGDKVQGVNFPEAAQASTNYPIAVLKNAPQAELARPVPHRWSPASRARRRWRRQASGPVTDSRDPPTAARPARTAHESGSGCRACSGSPPRSRSR